MELGGHLAEQEEKETSMQSDMSKETNLSAEEQ